MSTAPRAARKGGKVATETTPPLPTQTSEVVMSPFDLPSPAAPAPSVVTDANLFSSFMQNADSIATAAPIGGGVVRGRGLTTNLKEIAASADRSDVESRVKAAIESIVPPPPAVGLINLEADAAQLKHITHNDVTLASDFDRLSVAVKLAQANGKHRILVISPYVALTDAGLCATALNTKVGETVGVWDGSYHAGNNKCKIMFTTLANFMLYLKKVRSTPGFGVFTHLMFSGCVHAGRAIPDLDLALSVLRDELRNTKRELSPRVIICGATRDDLNSFFEPLKCAELHSQNGARKGSLTVFTPDETAALCEVSMKTTTGSAIPRGPTTAAEPIPTRIIEHANDTARLVLHLLMEHFDASKPMRAIVFSAEPAELEKVLRHANISEQADIVTSLSAFESNELPRNTIAILSSSTPESVASSVRANVVVDLGMEKRLVAAPAAEATLPLKATVRATSREVNSRLHMLGWGSSGIAFQVLAGPPATAACEEDQQATVTSCVLRAIRNELPVANCRETLFRATLAHHAAVEAGLASLTEQCAITAVDRPSVTFLGDLLARLPLSTDAGLIVVHGIVFGVPELAAAVAASALIDVRGHCPSGVEATAWLARCASFAETVRASRFSDTLVGATLIISAAKRSSIETVATETGANPVLLSRAVDVFKSTCQELKDFAYVSPSTEAQLLAQLEKFQNHFIYVIAASLSRNAVVVRAEADELRASSERANMMMQRTTKEVARNKFSPSNVTWALQKIVVPAHITNTQGRLIASNVSTLSHAFFHSSLLLLHPALSFDLVNEETVIFCATVNRNPKRLTTDVATSAKILDFREKWCLLLGAAMLRRSLPRDTTPAQLQTLVSVNHKRLDIATLRDELSSAFVQLVQDIESKEPQIAPQLSRTNLLTATPLADVAAVPGSNDEVLQRVFDGKAALHGAETITPEPEPSTQFDDDVEVEGATFAPIIEED